MDYGELTLDNDYEVMRMQEASREAERGWRYRHLRPAEVRFFAAVVARVRGFVARARGRALRAEQEQVPSTRQELAY